MIAFRVRTVKKGQKHVLSAQLVVIRTNPQVPPVSIVLLAATLAAPTVTLAHLAQLAQPCLSLVVVSVMIVRRGAMPTQAH